MINNGWVLRTIWTLVLVLALTSCGGRDNEGSFIPPPTSTPTAQPDAADSPETSTSKVSGLGIVLDVPAGWSSLTSLDHGLQLAERSEDLGTDEAPSGPRFTVTSGNTALPDTATMLDALAAPVDRKSALLEEPQTISVGGHPGVSVALAETQGGTVVVKRHAVVNAGGVNVLQFLLEAPEGQWAVRAPELEAILGSIEFESTASTTPTTSGDANPSVPAVRGSGSADDRFQLPYRETFTAPADPEWSRVIEDLGTWTWTVENGQLVAVGEGIEVTAPRAPWAPEFDLPDLPAVAVELEIHDSTETAACGLILVVDDGSDGQVVGVFIDSARQRFLVWSPVDFTDLIDGLPWTTDPRIEVGGGNDIQLILDVPLPEGEQILIYVNGEEVATTPTIGPLTAIAPSALFEAHNQMSECRFDNFSVIR